MIFHWKFWFMHKTDVVKRTIYYISVVISFWPVFVNGSEYNTAPGLFETGRNVVVLDTGWRFHYVGNDTSIQYAKQQTDNSNPVSIPHVFPSEKQGGHPYRGYGWYYKEVMIQDSFIGSRVSLVFEGVCLRAEVFVNGNRAGGSKFAYCPFTVDLDTFIKTGKKLSIAIRVDSRLLPRQIPDPAAHGWWIYGGIGREIYLVARKLHSIDNVQFRTFWRSNDTFDLSCSLSSHDGVQWDSVSLVVKTQGSPHPLWRYMLKSNDTLVHMGSVHPWTPDDPFRYELQCTPYFKGKKGAVVTLLRGFCQLTTKGTDLLLNGKPFYLRGLARHDMLRIDGTLLTHRERLTDLADIKSMGANFIRIAHFPQHHDIYELCDSLGLLVMDEIPAWKTDPGFLGSNSGKIFGSEYMQNVIEAHGNYTSVVIWSIGNQINSFKTTVADFVDAVATSVKKNDPSRLVTFCSYYYIWDKAFQYVDLIAINEYFGWELASLDMLPPMLDKIHNEWPDKPLIVSELGAQAQLGLRNNTPELAGPVKSMLEKDISEDHQALFIGAHMDTIRNHQSYVKGMIVWSYNDYMANMNKKRGPGAPVGLNACGVVTCKREHKLAYNVIKERYTSW